MIRPCRKCRAGVFERDAVPGRWLCRSCGRYARGNTSELDRFSAAHGNVAVVRLSDLDMTERKDR